MTLFDAYIRKVSEYVEEMRAQGRSVKVLSTPALLEGLPVKIGPGANPGVILREDTYAELGNPEAGSCAFALFTDKPGLIPDGRITLIGPDIKEAAGQSLPFGQVLMMGGAGLDDKNLEELQQPGFIGDQIEGYMVRSSSQSVWSRVSKDAAAKGFDFTSLGRALMALYRSGNGNIQAMEAVFVTSGRDDIKRLDDIAAQVRKINKELVRQAWKLRGYDIDCASDCSSCGDKAVCDEIKEVLKEQQARSPQPD